MCFSENARNIANYLYALHGQVAEVEDKTAGGLLLTESSKEKPSFGTVSN